ncbi:MAG: hypothetical protein PSX71_08825 [bacterium]|nr:hypothetical protein [bacterium]
MNKSDVGVLNRGDAVIVDGSAGIVVSVHEPEWVNNKTRAFCKELQGADIKFDDGRYGYVFADKIAPNNK